MIIAPHPYSKEGVGGQLVEKLKFDAIEAFNSRMLSRHNRKAKELAARLGLPMVASSDAHIADEIANGVTALDLDELSIEAVKDAIIRGKMRIHQERRTRSMTRVYSKKIGLLFHVSKRPRCEE